jgi:hypothetical protein
MAASSEASAAAPRAVVLGRRALPRVATSFPVRLRFAGLPGPLDGRARDLGAGGVCVATPTRFAIQELRGVTLLPQGGRLELGAAGCWQQEVSGTDGFFAGVRFLDVPADALEQIWDLVHQESKALTRWLREQSELSQLDLQDVMDLAHATRLRDVRVGEVLYRQGVGRDSIFFVMRGEIVCERRSPRQRVLGSARMGPGRLLGGMGAVTCAPPGETAIAARDTRLLEISQGAFENLQHASPMLAFQLGSLAMRSHLRRLEEELGRLGGKPDHAAC